MTEPEAQTVIRTSFERVAQSTCGLPQYESARAAVSIEETFPGTLTPDEVAALVANQFIHAKGAVFQQLGIGFEQDETAVLRETFGDVLAVASAPTSAGAATVARPAPAQPATAPPTASPRPAARPAPRSAAAPRSAPATPALPTDEELWAELIERPDLWADVRPDKASGNAKPNAPDFRSSIHKDGRFSKGLWLDNAPEWFVDPWA